mmetsp:Transcript_9276/g.18817  ORF Transcript_9276/g.18817 Transcript_9276/m.18817 type:complete len:203 (+) Transcript_9276:1849-2457(+)
MGLYGCAPFRSLRLRLDPRWSRFNLSSLFLLLLRSLPCDPPRSLRLSHPAVLFLSPVILRRRDGGLLLLLLLLRRVGPAVTTRGDESLPLLVALHPASCEGPLHAGVDLREDPLCLFRELTFEAPVAVPRLFPDRRIPRLEHILEHLLRRRRNLLQVVGVPPPKRRSQRADAGPPFLRVATLIRAPAHKELKDPKVVPVFRH